MAVSPWLAGLEGEEVPRLIESDSDKIRVVAGPGSGKTTGLKRRVRRLLETEATGPESIFVGTFTRAITEDLRQELEEYEDRGVEVSTLHSYALSLLRGNPRVLADRSLRFLLDFEKKAMLYDVKLRNEDDRRLSDLDDHLKRLQAAHSERRTLDDAEFSGAVHRWLREHDAMLISEVVPMVTEALDAEVLERGEFDHVVVDEYQDLTRCEQVMVERIWSGEGSLVVLGDDAQSIYGFRHNHPEGVGGFVEEHPDAEDIEIPENRRSGPEIVRVANLMMAEAEVERDPMIPTRDDLDGETTFLHWPSVEAEVEGLGAYMQERDDQDFLVLVPRKFIGYQLRNVIGEEARTEFREEVLDTPLAERRFALATLVADPEDSVALRTSLGFHREEGRGQQRNSPAYLSVFDADLDGTDLLARIAAGELDPAGRGQLNVRRLAEQLLAELNDVPDELEDLIDHLFDPALSADLEDEAAAAKAAQDLQRLREGAQQVREELNDPTLGSVLETIRYRIVTRVPLADPKDDARIRIMTLHSAKGLEADVIVVAGAADEMIPGEEDRAEQRRLLYVAVTRARDELIVSWPYRVPVRDARSNMLRVDDNEIFFADGSSYLQLNRTDLLPGGGPPPRAGLDWLADWDGTRGS